MGDETRSVETESIPAGDIPTLFETIVAWLEDSEWDYTPNPAKDYVSMDYAGEQGVWRIVIAVNESDAERRVLIYSIFPVRVPAARRTAAAEFVVRGSYGMKLANLELDMTDGEVRVKTAIDMVGGALRDDVLERLLLMNIFTANRYLAPLLSVAFGDKPAEAAVQLAEAVAQAHEGTLQ